MLSAFAHVTTWIFDLDNTLYPSSARVFDQIEARMTDWVMQALNVDRARADHLRRHWWRTHGTTLAGLIREHDIDPVPYLAHVHDIRLDDLMPDAALAAAIRALPGRKLVHTNGSLRHAQRVTSARGLGGVFDGLFGIEAAGFLPKPERGAFEAVLALAATSPGSAAMFEDDARNLVEPHAMGMATVHVEMCRAAGAHVHHHAPDLGAFLSRLTAGDAGPPPA